MNKILLAALLVMPALAFAEEGAASATVTAPKTGTRPDASFGVLIAATTSRNGVGRIIWTCTYRIAATTKTAIFRDGCPDKLKFEMTHR